MTAFIAQNSELCTYHSYSAGAELCTRDMYITTVYSLLFHFGHTCTAANSELVLTTAYSAVADFCTFDMYITTVYSTTFSTLATLCPAAIHSMYL